MPLGDPRDDRYICAELLMQVGVDIVGAHQQLWRIIHRYRAGLTKKEFDFLLQRILELQTTQNKLRRVADRCLHIPEL